MVKLRYYSHSGEDCLLWKFFGRQKTGFYVDVGAFDGVMFSNTFSFEEQGWSGICVEPHPDFYELCRRARPRAVCVHAACVADRDAQTVVFFAERLGLLSGIRGDRVENVCSRYRQHGLNFGGFEETVIPAITLDAILDNHLESGHKIDFVSIDVEGTELDVLYGLDFARFCPRVMVIEGNTREAEHAITDYLAIHKYTRAGRLGANVFYARELADVKRLRGIRFSCDLEQVPHPVVSSYRRPDHRRYIRRAWLDKPRRSMRRALHRSIVRRLKRMLARLGRAGRSGQS